MTILVFVLLVVIGVILIKNPEKLWKLECAIGWKFGEAGKTYLLLTRICGIICIGAAIYGAFFK